MELYLVRHGIAVDTGEYGVTRDEDRFLSSKGKRRTSRTAGALKKLGCAPEIIFTSPLARAAQTARIIAKRLSSRPECVEADFLKPAARIAAAVKELRASARASVMAVGHIPHLSRLASAILTGDERALDVDFDKSGVCCIEWGGESGRNDGARLAWLLDSRQCRRIGGR